MIFVLKTTSFCIVIEIHLNYSLILYGAPSMPRFFFPTVRPSVRGGTMHIAQNIERSQTVTSLILELEKF